MLAPRLVNSITHNHTLNIHVHMLKNLYKMHALLAITLSIQMEFLIEICFMLNYFIMGLPRLVGICQCNYKD